MAEGHTNEDKSSLHDTLWLYTQLIGGTLVGLSSFVLVFTCPMRITHNILIPALVPVFGVLYVVLFMAAKAALLMVMKSWKGLVLAAGLFVLGMGLGWIGMHGPLPYDDVADKGFSATRHILVAGSVVSGIGVGVAFLKGWLEPAR